VRHSLAVAVIVLAGAVPAQAQFRDHINLNRLNRRLGGCVIDYTHNHGEDRRIFSPILGKPRDLYVYLPPGYDPARAYPLVIYLHMAFADEHGYVGSRELAQLDRMIMTGQFPAAVVAIPDGLIEGENRIREPHSLFINGVRGRFEDHLVQEVYPFLISHYSIRPEAEAHALLGVSGGGLGAASIALRYPSLFGVVATLAAPLNLRYTTCMNDSRANFDPATYRWKTTYDPEEIVGAFYFGLRRIRAKTYVEPVFGTDVNAIPSYVAAVNPADLLFTANPQAGRPAMYINYGGRDNWNFDAQAESFVWLAQSRAFPVDAEKDPHARHSLLYFMRNHTRAYRWLATHLLPPT
jgi:hypothetical protein